MKPRCLVDSIGCFFFNPTARFSAFPIIYIPLELPKPTDISVCIRKSIASRIIGIAHFSPLNISFFPFAHYDPRCSILVLWEMRLNKGQAVSCNLIVLTDRWNNNLKPVGITSISNKQNVMHGFIQATVTAYAIKHTHLKIFSGSRST